MAIHEPTLVLVTAIVVAFSGGLLMLAHGPQRDVSCLRIWGAAMLLGALGLVLASFGRGLPLLPALADLLFILATGVSWTAGRLFAERAPRPMFVVAGPALWLLTRGTQPDHALWVACLIGAIYTIATATELWRTRAEHLSSRGPALVLLVIHAGLYAARSIDALIGGDLGAWSDPIAVTLVLESLLHTIGLGFLLLAMVKERVELRSSLQLRALAFLDGLTGVANRRRFDEQFDSETRRAARLGTSIALLMIDLDHFKRVNDSFGHQYGDTCLQAVAQRINACIRRPGDLVARYGGEEFALILPGADAPAAARFAEDIRRAVAALDLPAGPVTVSIGVAAYVPHDVDRASMLIRMADIALFAAKDAGRNTVRVKADMLPHSDVRDGSRSWPSTRLVA